MRWRLCEILTFNIPYKDAKHVTIFCVFHHLHWAFPLKNSISWLHKIIIFNMYWWNEWKQIFQLALCGARRETNHSMSRCQHLNLHQNTSRAINLPSDDNVTHHESYRMFDATLPMIYNCRNGSSGDRVWNLDPSKSWQWEMFAHHNSTALQLLQQSP